MIHRPKLILHIGGPKTGSSALQEFLTNNPILINDQGQIIEYWKLSASQEKKGGAFDFHPVSSLEPPSEYPYHNSHALKGVIKNKCVHEIFHPFILEHVSTTNNIFVFSSEEWAIDFNVLDVKECVCVDVAFDSLLFLNVRPQVDMIISSYLQWDLWKEHGSIEQTIETLSSISNWAKQLQNTRKFGIHDFHVVYSMHLIETFCNVFNINSEKFKPLHSKRINKSLPLEAISLLFKNREILRNHVNADVDFLIENILDKYSVDSQNLKLFVPPMIVNSVYEYFIESNVQLMGYLEKTDAERYVADAERALLDLLNTSGRVTLQEVEINSFFLEKLVVGALSEALITRRQLGTVRRQKDILL